MPGNFRTSGEEAELEQDELDGRKGTKPIGEPIVTLLRQVEVGLANGKTLF